MYQIAELKLRAHECTGHSFTLFTLPNGGSIQVPVIIAGVFLLQTHGAPLTGYELPDDVTPEGVTNQSPTLERNVSVLKSVNPGGTHMAKPSISSLSAWMTVLSTMVFTVIA